MNGASADRHRFDRYAVECLATKAVSASSSRPSKAAARLLLVLRQRIDELFQIDGTAVALSKAG